MIDVTELEKKIEEAVAVDDTRALDDLHNELYQKSGQRQGPYDAALELKPEYTKAFDDNVLEGDFIVDWANRIARAKRLIEYRLKTAFGFSGHRLVDVGDSWFQYPILLEDIIDNFNKLDEFAVYSLSAGGALIEDMAQRREYISALTETNASVMLLSGGGNDAFGNDRFAQLLNPYEPGSSPQALVNQQALERMFDRILGFYREICSDVDRNHPHVTIFGHGYDTPFPMNGGDYFGVFFEAAGIPLDVGRQVIELIVQHFRSRLLQLTEEFSNYRFVDLTGTVGNHPNSWDDELHPENAGFRRASAPLITAVKNHLSNLPEDDLEAVSRTTTRLSNALESGGRSIVLDPGHGGTTSNSSSWNNAIGPSGTLEKTWTLDVCLRAKSVLEARGYLVTLTRTTDVNPNLAQRRRVARDIAADCFVSIHFNASSNHNAQGTETFVHTAASSPRSIKLMRTVQASMTAALGHRDRNRHNTANGILRANFGVIRESGHHPNTAAVLHEVSFMDRINEENRIKQASYRSRIAEAIADGVDSFFAVGLENGFEFEANDAEGYDDAIHMRAAETGLSVVQYLGFSEVLHY